MRQMKRPAALLLALALVLGLEAAPASAKTVESAKGENVFFYAADRDGKSVLMAVVPLENLRALAHGQKNGENYWYSSTDNYPTTQYCEARGITPGELVDHIKKVSTAAGASSLSFSSGDKLDFMATDGFGNYSRTWTYDQLYGEKRYYFEGMYDAAHGWKTGWEVGGEDSSKFGVSLETYRAAYQESDPYYADKRAALDGGVEMPVLLAVASSSGRTTSATLVASTEAGISGRVADNGGKAAGSLRSLLCDETALRLCIPMTEADLMAAHRTAYDNFKWVYNLRLTQRSPGVTTKGTVAAPQASFQKSADGKTLTITASCPTAGAEIYTSFDGAPQTKYTGPVSYDITGRDLSSNPVTFYMTAVKEGYDDAGVVSVKYPQSGVRFESLYAGMLGQDVVFTAEADVTRGDWQDWSSALLGVSMKEPEGTGYTALREGEYRVDGGARTVTFDKALFTVPGSYSFLFYAKGFANKNLALSMKRAAPALSGVSAPLGCDVVLEFADTEYQSGLYLYLTPEGGESALISASYVDRTRPGRAVVKAEWFELDSCPAKTPGTYTLEAVNSGYSPASRTVSLTLTQPGAFTDVAPGAWYAGGVAYVVERGLFNGTGGGKFSPDATMTRAMFATVLHRVAGTPEAGAGDGFSDVAADSWYAGAVAWAAGEGYLTGTGGGAFSPDAEITLEQMAAILWRYAGSPATAAAARDSLGPVSAWADAGLKWGAEQGLLDGIEGTLSARGAATRAQVAQVMMSFNEMEGE